MGAAWHRQLCDRVKRRTSPGALVCVCICEQSQGLPKRQPEVTLAALSADLVLRIQSQGRDLTNSAVISTGNCPCQTFTGCVLPGRAWLLAESKELRRKMLAEPVLDSHTVTVNIVVDGCTVCSRNGWSVTEQN